MTSDCFIFEKVSVSWTDAAMLGHSLKLIKSSPTLLLGVLKVAALNVNEILDDFLEEIREKFSPNYFSEPQSPNDLSIRVCCLTNQLELYKNFSNMSRKRERIYLSHAFNASSLLSSQRAWWKLVGTRRWHGKHKLHQHVLSLWQCAVEHDCFLPWRFLCVSVVLPCKESGL